MVLGYQIGQESYLKVCGLLYRKHLSQGTCSGKVFILLTCSKKVQTIAGKVLFPGATNNDMLRLHMELKGPFPKKMLRKGAFTELHFDQDLNFVSIEEDPVTKKIVKRLVNMKAKDIGSIISSSPGEDPKMVANFKDLMEKIFTLDPDKRLIVQHMFIFMMRHN